MPDTPISLFISYAHADSGFVDRLEADLRQQGFDPWVDRQRLKGGQRWRRELQEAVEGAQVLLIVLSPDAIASQNVQIEYDYVLELGNVVIPLYYRQCEVPMELRAIQWIDFRHSYEQGLTALVQVLRTQQDKTTPTHLSAQTQPSDLGHQPVQKEQAEARHPPFNNLPAQLTPLIGREQEIQAVCALVLQAEVRLVTLIGTGGVGKTRLGLQIATELLEDFADGVCFVPLAPISDPALVIPTIAKTLSLREVADQSALEQLKAYLREKQLLLLLDNFEQILSAGPELTELLLACPPLKILVTSRAALHLQGEYEFAVSPLALPELLHFPQSEDLAQYAAVALFVQRAKAIKPDFHLTAANARTIAEICIHLDGLPLAIELAAARLKLLPPQMLLARLSQRLQVLTGGARDLPARQQTLQKTLAWSYDLLTSEEQLFFRRLSVFVGGCTLQAIEALCAALDKSNGAGGVLDGVASLIDKSLLQQREQEENEPRLVLLETIREYGLEVLAASGEMETTRQAHAEYYLVLAEEAEPHLREAQQLLWLRRLDREQENLRAALDWLIAQEEVEQTLRFCGALWWFWQTRGYWSEARTFLERSLARSEGASISLRVKVLQADASVTLQQGDYARAEELAKLSLALYRELGNTRGIADCLGLLVELAWRRGKMVEATTLSEEQVRLMRQVGEPGEVADALYSLAEVVSRRGELAKGEALYQEARMLYRKAGNDLGVAATLIMSASELWWLSLADAATIQTIRHRLQEGQTIVTKLGSRHWIGFCSWLGVLVALSEGKTARAESLAQEHLAIFREIGNRYRVAWALHILGRVEAQRGALTAARSWYQQSLALTLELGDKFVTPFNLEGLAGVLLAQGELIWAAHLLGAAEALREATGVPLRPGDRAGYEQAVATARAQLGEEVFAAAWQAGRMMPLEQVIDRALKMGDETSKQERSTAHSTTPKGAGGKP